MLHTKYQSSWPCGFKKEDFLKFSSWKSIFSLCDLDMQWAKSIWTIFKEGQIRNILPSLVKNQPVVKEMPFEAIVDDTRRTKDIQNICYHVAAFMIPFNLLCNRTMFRKRLNLIFWPHTLGSWVEGGGGGVCVQNICHVAEFMIPFNLICNMTMFWKVDFLPTDWVNAMWGSARKIFAAMLLQ